MTASTVMVLLPIVKEQYATPHHAFDWHSFKYSLKRRFQGSSLIAIGHIEPRSAVGKEGAAGRWSSTTYVTGAI